MIVTREVKVTPAWDTGTRERGCHSCDLIFALRGPKGVLEFEIYTGWYLNNEHRTPTPSRVSYHSVTPISQDDVLREGCEWLGGNPCYSDSLCCSQAMFTALVEKGSDGMWEEMEKLYRELFETEPAWLVEDYDNMAASLASKEGKG